MNLFDLTGKTALVTGGNKGLGKGMAEGLCLSSVSWQAEICLQTAVERSLIWHLCSASLAGLRFLLMLLQRVAQLTKALANEWASKGICVNAIAPGYMATQMNTGLIEDPRRNTEILSRIPMGRWGNEQDMKGVVVFLASNASDYLSGAVIPVDGGYLGR